MPIGLTDDADSKAGRLQHSAKDRHREAGMIDVGVAGHEHDIEFVPAAALEPQPSSSAGVEDGATILPTDAARLKGRHRDAR